MTVINFETYDTKNRFISNIEQYWLINRQEIFIPLRA